MALPSVPTHFNMVPGVPEDIGTSILNTIKQRDWKGLKSVPSWAQFWENRSSSSPVKILEYGAGVGLFTSLYVNSIKNMYPDMRLEVTCVDPWADFSKFVVKDDDRVSIKFHKKKGQDFSLEDAHYDCILLSHSVYYFKDEILGGPDFTKRLLGHLAQDGLMVVIAMRSDYNDLQTRTEWGSHREHLCTLQKFEKEVFPYCESGMDGKGLYLSNPMAITFEQVTSSMTDYGIGFEVHDLQPAWIEFGPLPDTWEELSPWAEAVFKHISRGRIQHIDPSHMDYFLEQVKGCTHVGDGKHSISHLASIALIPKQ